MIRTIKKFGVKKCCGCGRRPVFSVHSMFCRTCARLAFRMRMRRFPPEAEEAVWNYIRKYDYRCHYTKMLLEMDDTKSQWFCVFDHLIPLEPKTIVLTSALINEIKTALSEKEFWFYVGQLADFKNKGRKIKKIRLAYWRRKTMAHIEGDSPLGKQGTVPFNIPGKKPIWPHPKDKKCDICGRPVFNIRSKYCRRCSHFAHRLEMQGFGAKTVQEILDHVRKRGFTCFFTGVPLDMTNDRSPWYCVFNYLTPGDHSKVVLTCALFNEMKSDLSIKEFWYYIRQLANYKRKGTKIRKKKLVYWYRMTRRER